MHVSVGSKANSSLLDITTITFYQYFTKFAHQTRPNLPVQRQVFSMERETANRPAGTPEPYAAIEHEHQWIRTVECSGAMES